MQLATYSRSTAIGLCVLALLVSSAGGCKQEAPRATAPGSGATQGSLAFKDLLAHSVVAGTFPVKVKGPQGSKVELIANGKKVGEAAGQPIQWDTTKGPDGAVDLELRSGDKSTKVSVVVLNNGSEVFFKNGSSGKVSVPPTGYEHQHLRYHWDMGAETKRVLAILTWDKPGFDLELSVGQGTCPHHGKQVAAKQSTTSPITLIHDPADGKQLDSGQWFTHVRLQNPDQMRGKETPFAIRAYQLR